jgi:hypothetical protein
MPALSFDPGLSRLAARARVSQTFFDLDQAKRQQFEAAVLKASSFATLPSWCQQLITQAQAEHPADSRT